MEYDDLLQKVSKPINEVLYPEEIRMIYIARILKSLNDINDKLEKLVDLHTGRYVER